MHWICIRTLVRRNPSSYCIWLSLFCLKTMGFLLFSLLLCCNCISNWLRVGWRLFLGSRWKYFPIFLFSQIRHLVPSLGVWLLLCYLLIFIIFIFSDCKFLLHMHGNFLCFQRRFHHIRNNCSGRWLNFSIIHSNVLHCMRVWIYAPIKFIVIVSIINRDVFHSIDTRIHLVNLLGDLVIWWTILKIIRIRLMPPDLFMSFIIHSIFMESLRIILCLTFLCINYTAEDLFYFIELIRWSTFCLSTLNLICIFTHRDCG